MNDVFNVSSLESAGWKSRMLPGYAGLIGPLWTKKESSGWSYGILCCAQHLNPAGVVHGGLIMSLLDHALSSLAWEHAERQTCVTLQMETKFMASAGAGEFLKVSGRIIGSTSTMVFASGELRSAERVLVTASALLKILRKAA